MAPWAGKVVVVHPPKVKLITCARVKTDKRSVYDLARLLLVGWLPEVWVPPDHVRDLRALVSHRWRLVRTRAATKNRLHSVLQRNALKAPRGSIFTDKHRDWWKQLDVSPTERLRVRQDLGTVDHLTVQIEDVETEIKRLSTNSLWADQVRYLMQLPGFGLKVTMTVLAAIGDITRFPTDKKLVGYSGLGAGGHDSGKTHRGKGITKEGRKELRWALVEATHHAVRTHAHWKTEFERLTKRIGKHKAYVAIARKLLVAVWHVLTKQEVARFTDEHQVARKMMTWSGKLTEDHRHGMNTPQFVRYQLLRLDIGDEITHVQSGSRKRRIASVKEVLALGPELQLPV